MNKTIWTQSQAWGLVGAAYERFSEDFSDALLHCVQRLNPQPTEKILDVATGTGWTARLIAARDAQVSALDYSEAFIIAGKKIAQQQQLAINFVEGDAHQIPYPAAHFDAVTSTFGVIFVSDPEKAASELGRVCKPGGRLALAVWKTDSTLHQLSREVIAPFSNKPQGTAPPSPFAWGNEARLKALLNEGFKLSFESGTSVLRKPNAAAIWEFWLQTHGLTVARLNALDDQKKIEFKQAFIDFHQQFQTPSGIAMPRDYIVVTGVRR